MQPPAEWQTTLGRLETVQSNWNRPNPVIFQIWNVFAVIATPCFPPTPRPTGARPAEALWLSGKLYLFRQPTLVLRWIIEEFCFHGATRWAGSFLRSRLAGARNGAIISTPWLRGGWLSIVKGLACP
jgi:hypothetical protein